MVSMSRVATGLEKAGKYSIVACCFFTPLSTSLMGAFGALVILFWLISGKITKLPRIIKDNPVAVASSALIILFVIGMLYSPAPWDEIIDVFKKYRELFFIPAIMCLMLDDTKKLDDLAINAFFAGCIILLAISYAMALGIIPSARYGNSITFHITHSFFMAILAFWTANKTIDSSKYRPVWFILLAAVIGNIVYIAPGRTGMLTFLFLCLLIIWQRLSWKKQILGFIALALLTGAAYFSSNNIQTRVTDVIEDVQTYERGMSRTSQGRRLDWWFGCLELIKEKPVLGHGTGSFTMAHDRLIKGTEVDPTDNPHCEYLFIAVQLGGIGLLAFLAIFAAGWYCSLRLQPEKRRLAQGVIVSMMAGCLMNSFLFDSHQGHYFAILLALLCVPFSSTIVSNYPKEQT